LTGVRIYEATVRHVITYNRVAIMVHTDFDVSFTHICYLTGVPHISSDGLWDEARYALILIVGGKDVLVEIDSDAKRINNMQPVRMYRQGSLPPDCRDCTITINTVEYVQVNRYMSWLAERGFPDDVIKKHRRQFKN